MKKNKKGRNKAVGLITVSRPDSVEAEQFRTVRTNIKFSMIDNDIKSLVVTSSAPGEGKSTISSNLAVTFADQNKRVLLVDADMRKPSLHRIFKLKNFMGLTTLLTEKNTSVQSVCNKTVVEGLMVITSGPLPPNPSELLDSKKMDQLMTELMQDFDMVIFDMPPIVAITDAQIMASKVDGTILVVRKEVATKEAALKAKQLLKIVNANVIGAVLNGAEKKKDTAYKYYGTEKKYK